MATTIVHAADVHLETVFPDVRGGSARRAALADAFERIIDLALERNADVLTIGGDLYESERAGPATARFLFAAFARFGKGRGHPAQLNLGDCFAYAVARNNGAPVLFTGEDFSQTDIARAI